MRNVDWRSWGLNEGVLVEPAREDGRIVLWVPGERDRTFQYWERIGATPRDEEVETEHEIRAAPAAAIRARRRLSGGLLGRLAEKLTGRGGDATWSLPNGLAAERFGERESDLALAWPREDSGTIDEERIRRRWPESVRIRRLGERVYLVGGVEARSRLPAEAASNPDDSVDSIEAVERLVEATRGSGDRRGEALALADLGALVLNAGDAGLAVARLGRALDLWRELNDRGGEIDALANLGRALFLLDRPEDARRTLESALALSRTAGDVRAEELVLERLSLALLNRRDFGGAAAVLDQALEAARASGDLRREARVLWIGAIAWAEMNRPDQALTLAEESAGLLRALGGPEASWFEAQIRRYRSAALVRSDAAALLGGSIDASAATMGRAPTAPGASAGPGVLRMALSATRAMATFLGTGMRTTSADERQNRLAICRTCEHHAGLRCRICGCFTKAKAAMPHERCPIGRW